MVTYDNGSNSFSGFHLGSQDEQRQSPPSVSTVSLYKQKIDALFDDNKSITSLHIQYAAITDIMRKDSKASIVHESKIPKGEDEANYCQNKIKNINNTVQDRIEKMFADMAGEPTQSSDSIGVHTFSVHYLGSTSLPSKVTSLSGLQTPLRDLYFTYRRNYRPKNNTFSSRLEISKNGLKIRYKCDRGDVEQLNPFPTIAVWSAVKFVIQPLEREGNFEYAFVPLITDPDNIDRHALFQQLESVDKKYILSHNENSHSPLFAVVMRKLGVAKQLECHGFVCQTTEDAIVIAATLYKSLMAHMSRQDHISNKKLKNRNGVSCMSVASSLLANDPPARPPRKKQSSSSISGDSDRADGFSGSGSFSEKPKEAPKFPSDQLHHISLAAIEAKKITVDEVKARLDVIKQSDSGSEERRSNKSFVQNHYNMKPNQQSKNGQSCSESSTRSKVSEKIELFRQLEKKKTLQRPPTLPPPIPTKPPSQSQADSNSGTLKRTQSLRRTLSDTGDILTKVAIPRSGSFLNAGGLTRYKSIGHRYNGKKGGGSPLGFNELFSEFKVQENLHSMDEILNVIIDPEGMSFNDLKPIYKEFLLKLAVTLTKDEIFQHSKAIMKKQKKKVLRKNSSFQIKRKKFFKGASGLRMVFRLPFGKIHHMDKHMNYFEPQVSLEKKPISESSVSTTSYDIRQFRPKESELSVPKRQTVRRRNSKRTDKTVLVSKRNGKVSRPGERTSASEDSDFLNSSNRLGCQNRNSSSGYVSCSECESESCVDRCYCSLKPGSKSKCYCSAEERRDPVKMKLLGKGCKECMKEAYDGDYSYCSCDSESCADSNKCYCTGPRRNALHHSQSSDYVRNPRKFYSDRIKSNLEDIDAKPRARSKTANRRRTRSSDSLALDYELLLPNKPRDARSRNMHRLTVRSTGAGSQDALSVKKSAEMAALFADVRLSQRTDVRSLAGGRRSKPMALPATASRAMPSFTRMFDHRPLSRNASLEDTLGYFP